MGAGVDSQITRYLRLPVVPRVMGFDARLQFLHPSDAVDALVVVTAQDLAGTFNVAADDMVTLSQALRMMGRPTIGVPQPLTPLVATMGRQARLLDFSTDQINALTYGRGMDTSRFRTATGFSPAYTSKQALTEFVAATTPGLLSVDRVDALFGHLGRRAAAQPRIPVVADAEIIDFVSREASGPGARRSPAAGPQADDPEPTSRPLPRHRTIWSTSSAIWSTWSGRAWPP